MQIKKTSVTNLILGVCGLIFLVFIFVLFSNKSTSTQSTTPVSYSGDTQVIDITAKGGFTPNVITAKANTDTVLNVITNKTFDCSSSVRIPSMNISKNLPLTGNTQIALGAHNPGEVIDGTCLMGMYSFKIKFI